MKKIFGTLFLICLALSANAQLLWKVSGNGLENPSYIFGTHHLAPYSILDSIEGLRPAFASATQVVGELKMSDMQSPIAMQMMQEMMMIPGADDIHTYLTVDEYIMVNKFAKENLGFSLDAMPKVKPAFISNNAMMALYVKNVPGYKPQEQLDTYFQTLGTEVGKKIDALETLAFQFEILFGTPLKRQAEALVCMVSNVDKTLDDAKRLTKAYMAQDLQTMYEISLEKEGTKCDPLPGEMESLIDNRNEAWGQKLPIMMQKEPTFIAVGALHLPGDKGILNILRLKGYTVEPVK